MFEEDKNLYETVFNILPDSIVLIDKNGILVDMNHRLEEWLGYKREEILNLHLLELPILTKKSKVEVAKRFASRMSGKEVLPYEIEFQAKDGSISIGLIRAAAIHDDKNKITHDLVLVTNTTSDKFLNAQIADAERKYKYLFDNLPYGFAYHKVIFDEDGNVVDYIFEEINKNFENITNLKKSNVVGKKVTEVLPNIKEEEFDWINTFGKLAKERKPMVFETYITSFNKWFKVAAYSPEEGYVVNIFYDITEDKENENKVKKSADELLQKLDELARMNKLMENRELKLQELKDKLKNA